MKLYGAYNFNCVYMNTWRFARHEFTNLWLETIWPTLFGEIRLSPQNRSRNKQDKWVNGYGYHEEKDGRLQKLADN